MVGLDDGECAGLGCNEHTSCIVPQAEPDLEVCVELSSGHGTQVESCRSHAADVPDLGNDRSEHVALTGAPPVVRSKPCANKCLRQ